MAVKTRECITIDPERVKGASHEQLERLADCVILCREWAEILRLHPDTMVSICYDAEKVLSSDKRARSRVNYGNGEGLWIARVDMERAEYNKFRVYWSIMGLAPKRDSSRELDVIHELLHIACYEYTGVAEAFGGDYTELLQKKEETLVSRLEKAFGGIYDLREV